MMFWNLSLLGQVAAEGAVEGGTAASTVSSIWDFAVKGGPMMIPIALCSLAAGTVILERLISLRRRNIIPPGFLPGLKKTLDEGGDSRTEAMEYCRNDNSSVANILEKPINASWLAVDNAEPLVGCFTWLGSRWMMRPHRCCFM